METVRTYPMGNSPSPSGGSDIMKFETAVQLSGFSTPSISNLTFTQLKELAESVIEADKLLVFKEVVIQDVTAPTTGHNIPVNVAEIAATAPGIASSYKLTFIVGNYAFIAELNGVNQIVAVVANSL